jgi:hypothetical protein
MLKPRVTCWMCFRLYKVLEEPVYIQSGEEKYKTGLQLGKFKLIYLVTVSGSFISTLQFSCELNVHSSFRSFQLSGHSSYSPVVLKFLT